MMQLFTIGYEGAAVADFVRTLVDVGVELLLDIRELPQSRRPGFSKTSLATAVETAGINYKHVRQLGDPKPGRDAARRGDFDGFLRIFNAHLDLAASQSALTLAADMASEQVTVLMCYERSHHQCHRNIVAAHMKALGSFDLRHLGVRPGIAGEGAKGNGGTARLVGA